jgi:hypothetical protein
MAIEEQQASGAQDARWPRAGQEVLVDAPPIAGWPREPQRCAVVEMRGVNAHLTTPEGLPALPRGSPVAVSVPVGDGWHRLEGWVAATGPELVVRLTPPPDRRQHRRHAVDLPAEVELLGPPGTPSTIVAGRAVDVSAGGARVRVAEPIPTGSRAFVAISLPDGPPVLALAEALALHGDEVHLRFTTISDDQRGRLVLYMSALRQP